MTNRTCIPFSMVNSLLDAWISNPKSILRECWISFNPKNKHRIGIDNTTREFRMEEFESYEECIRWIK